MVFGVDVSEFQEGINYAQAVDEGGVNFAILRAGYGRDVSQQDGLFEEHYAGFGAQHIPMGAYQYSYTDSVARAREEAHAMIEWCRDKNLQLGAWYDLEEGRIHALGRDTVCAIAEAWIEEMEKAGYKAGVYASHSWFGDVLKPLKDKGIRIWSALWSKNDPPGYGICWQFGGDANLMRDKHVPGIPGDCDQDYWLGSVETATPPAEKDGSDIAVPLRQLQEGMEGDDVRSMQILLDALGHSVGPCGFDGDFGPATASALKMFQSLKGIDVDAICGPITWGKLIRG